MLFHSHTYNENAYKKSLSKLAKTKRIVVSHKVEEGYHYFILS